METLREVVQGKRSLSPAEVRDLIRDINPEFVFLWREALLTGKLNYDVALVQAIYQARNREALILIALAIRYGANPNMYVSTPRIGSLHILGYVYTVLLPMVPDTELIELIIVMLLLSGSKGSMPVFDATGGKIVENPMESSAKGLNITEWIQEQGIDSIIGKVGVDVAAALDLDVVTQMGIFLDRLDLIVTPITNDYMVNTIRSFSGKILVKAPPKKTWIFNGIDYDVMEEAILYINSTAVLYFLDAGVIPSYLLINKLLLQIQQHHGRVREEEEKMLLAMISRGVTLDREQFAMFEGDFAGKVMTEYDQPYWKKVCRVRTDEIITDRLRHLAFSLNIDPTLEKASVCDALKQMTSAEPDKLLAAAVKRQQQRTSGDLSLVSEYINSNPPQLVCRNRTLLQHDPFEYGDVELATYRDEQEVVWCFTSDMFENLVKNGTNPYTMQKLPQSFTEQLSLQLETLKRLGIDYMKPISFEEAVKGLTEKDEISNIETDKIVASIIALAALNGVNERELRSKSVFHLQEALAAIGVQADLGNLSSSHTFATFARTANIILRKKPELAADLFSVLQN